MNGEYKEFNQRVEGLESTSILSLPEATAKTVFEQEFANLKKGLEAQQRISWQIVVGVAIAFLFTIGLVAVEIILFHSRSNKDLLDLQNQSFQEIQELRRENFEMELRLQKNINEIGPELKQSQSR